MIVYDPDRKEPHWAPGAAEYLASQISKDARCLEWGGGMSTPWLGSLVPDGSVLTIEDDTDWTERIWKMTDSMLHCCVLNVSRYSSQYATPVPHLPDFDVYLIDGYQRIKCLEQAIEVSTPGNLLVLDDALDYVGDWHPPSVKVFSMPHPYAGKKVTKNLWGNTYLKVGDLHHEMKETWVWRVV